MPTSNEILIDLMLRHQIYLRRYEKHVQNRVLTLLQDTETDLRQIIADQFVLGSNISTTRYHAMEQAISKIRKSTLEGVFHLIEDEAQKLVDLEAQHTARSIEKSLPVIFETLLPTPQAISSIVTTTPLQGQVMSVWANKLVSDDIIRITSQLRIAMMEGQTAREASERIVGTAQLKGTNGQTIITARHADTIARTGLQTFANRIREDIFLENQEVISNERYTATLDRRTTLLCAGLDGNLYKTGQGPKPPLHWSCRSIRIALMNDRVLGHRPFNASTKRQLVKEYNQKNGFPADQEIGYGHKGKFDQFASKRKREMIGRVPAKMTYEEWMRKQPKWFQQDVLGKERMTLFRSGKIRMEQFVDHNGKELTIKQLYAIVNRT